MRIRPHGTLFVREGHSAEAGKSSMLVGLLQLPEATQPERMHLALPVFAAGGYGGMGLELDLSSPREPVDWSGRRSWPTEWSLLADLAAEQIWNRAGPGEGMSLFARATRFEATAGNAWYLVVAVTDSKAMTALPGEQLFDLRFGALSAPRAARYKSFSSTGATLDQVLLQPLLQIGDRRLALQSTLPPEMIDLSMACHRLRGNSMRSASEAEQLDAIHRHPSGIWSVTAKDAMQPDSHFFKFCQAMAAYDGPALDRPQTAEQHDAREAYAAAAMRRILLQEAGEAEEEQPEGPQMA